MKCIYELSFSISDFVGIKFGKTISPWDHGIPNTSFKEDLDVYSTIDKSRG